MDDELLTAVQKLKPIAEDHGLTLAQLAIAWVLQNPNVASALVGASRPEQIVDNVESLKVLPLLTPEVLAEIDEVLGNKPAPAQARFG